MRRIKSRGRVPRDKYEEYMDVQLMQFLRQYKITEANDWEADFRDPLAPERMDDLAAKFRAPADRLRKMIDYYQRVTSESYGTDGYGSGGYIGDEPDYIELIPSRDDLDVTDNIVLMREFVETYELAEGDFVRDFMQGESSAQDLAAKYRAPLDEVEEILEALGRLHIVESFVSGGGTTEAAGRRQRRESSIQPVAKSC